MKKLLTATLFCVIFINLRGQTITVEGIVIDAADKTPLSYVNIFVKGTSIGTYTDLKGNFQLNMPAGGGTLVFIFIGYEKKEIKVTEATRLEVKLSDKVITTKEAEILPGVNPADIIMQKVNDLRKKHDPENLESFSYKSYNKFVVNINRDSDSAFFDQVDTSDNFVDTLVNKMNLFLMESITEKIYKKPGKYKEIVEASRISGLKNGMYALLATEIQSFSFYKNYVTILGQEYLSPIADGNTKKYLFVLQDSIEENGEKSYVIHYHPRKGKNFDGLTGLLYINAQNYAVLKATAKVADKDGFSLQLVQSYVKMGEDSYFPTIYTAEFSFTSISVGISDTATKTDKSLTPLGKSKTYLYNVQLNPKLKRNQFDNVELDYAPDALTKGEEFWNKNRQEKLDSKDSLTYVIVDSIGKELNLDRRLEFLRIAQTGKWPIGPIDVHINDIFRFNNFEGFRLGSKISTNNRLSRHFSVGGYYAYGFKDVHSKFGGNLDVFFNKTQSSGLEFLYSNDVAETGQHPVLQYEPQNEERIREIYISVMDRVERSKASIKLRTLRYMTVAAGFERVNKLATTTYRFGNNNQQYFRYANAVVSLRYAPFEKLIKSFDRFKAKDSKWPVFYATFTKGFKNLIDGQFDFLRTDIMVDYNFRIIHTGRSYIRLAAGNVSGTVPYTELYFGRAGYNAKNLSVVTPGAFETMRYNEFFGNRYAAVFYKHNFGSLLFKTKKFKPEINFVTNAFFSSFYSSADSTGGEASLHKNFPLKPANKGFYESGLQINNIFILNGFFGYGIGVFYRYGPYSLPKSIDNLAVKLSFTVSL